MRMITTATIMTTGTGTTTGVGVTDAKKGLLFYLLYITTTKTGWLPFATNPFIFGW
jgi:hypothetical protein